MTYIKNFTTTYTIGHHTYTVTAPAEFDSKTNQPIHNVKLDGHAAEIARQMYRNDQGLISLKQIKQYRKQHHLTQEDLAKQTDFSVTTIRLYEAGAFPTKHNNEILTKLINN